MKKNKVNNSMENVNKMLYNDFEWVCSRIAALKCNGINSGPEWDELQKAKKRLLTDR